MAKVVIWASGNARPMQSASTTGRPVRAATWKLWSEFDPPISSDMTAANGPAETLREHLDRTGGDIGVGEPLLTDQRRPHGRDHRDQVVVGEGFGGNDHWPEPARGLRPQVQERVVGVPSAPRPEDPGAGGEVLDLGGREFAGARGHAAGKASGSGRCPRRLGTPALAGTAARRAAEPRNAPPLGWHPRLGTPVSRPARAVLRTAHDVTAVLPHDTYSLGRPLRHRHQERCMPVNGS